MDRRSALLALALACPACAPAPAVELIGRADGLLAADVAGRDAAWLRGQMGKSVRLGDDVRRVVPAAPPSRIAFRVELPRGARLTFACGVDARRAGAAPVEFVVTARQAGREAVVFDALLDPTNRPAHRVWLAGDADLGAFRGATELVLETRSAETPADPRAVAWALPVVTSGAAAPLVVVYLVDTLRADHTSLLGYPRPTTPELERFAAGAAVFENAVAPTSWTKPSVASVFTSLLPGRHGAVHLRDPFAPKEATLAERLRQRGFTTGAFVANSVIYEDGSGFERGFDAFRGIRDAEGRASTRARASDVVSAALEFLDASRGLPTFLYLHTMDPHIPYAPPPPFDTMFPPAPTPESPGRDPREQADPGAHTASYVARYDGEIAYGDRELGRFLAGLRERGLLEGALVVFLSDHGEEFAERGNWGHGTSLYDELLRIPLVVKFPNARHAGRRVAHPVQALDVLPTILEGLDLPADPALQGTPLQRALGAPGPERPAIVEISHRGVVAHGARTARDKYVRRFAPQGDELLFDLAADPGETRNHADARRDRVRALRAAIEPALRPNPFRSVVRVAGRGDFRLEIATAGFLEEVRADSLGPDESAVEAPGRGALHLRLRPRPDAPREVSFVVRPRGTPVRLSGTRDGRPIQKGDVFVGAAGRHPAALPALLPDLDAAENPLAPAGLPPAGISLWLALAPGRQALDLDAEAQERLRALGYLQ